jgi:hypothetical protein
VNGRGSERANGWQGRACALLNLLRTIFERVERSNQSGLTSLERELTNVKAGRVSLSTF